MAISLFHTDRWLRQHRILAVLSLILAIACAAYGFLRLRPQWRLYQDTLDEKESVNSKLNATAWPQDPERLQAILKDFKAKLGKSNAKMVNGMTPDTMQLLEQATVLFRERIDAAYGSTEVFLEKSSQTEYKDQYDRLASDLREKGVYLTSEIFGMDEETSEDLKYQMLLKLWTARAVTERIFASGLAIQRRQDSRKRPMSLITALPVKEYILAAGDTSPYLIEIPVKVEMTGTMEQLQAFIQSLYTEDCFLPIIQMELSTPPPPPPPATENGQPGQVAQRTILVKVICCSFFLPGNAPTRSSLPNSQMQIMPSGA